MQITFFKNESHFTRSVSLVSSCQNWKVEKPSRTLRIPKGIFWLYGFLLWGYLGFLISSSISQNGWQVALAYLWQIALAYLIWLPAHEFSHALYLWMTGRKVKAIRFFPPKAESTDRDIRAFVTPAFGVFRRSERALFSLFPLIWVTLLPLVLSIFLPSLRAFLISLALLNIGGARYDIEDTINLLFVPKGALLFERVWLTVTNEEPITMHKLELPVGRDEIIHREWRYEKGVLTEVIPPEVDGNMDAQFAEIRKQFNLPEPTE